MPLYRTIPDAAINSTNRSSLPVYFSGANERLQVQNNGSNQTFRHIRLNEVNILSDNKHIKCIKDGSNTYYECVEWNFFPINCTMNVNNSLRAIFRVYSTIVSLTSITETPSAPVISSKGSYISSTQVSQLNEGVYTITATVNSNINTGSWNASQCYIEVKNTYGLRFRLYALPHNYLPVYIAVNGWGNINNSNNGKFYFVVNDQIENSNYDTLRNPNHLLLHKFIQGYDFHKLSSLINASYVGYGGETLPSSSNQIIFTFGYRENNNDERWQIPSESIALSSSPVGNLYYQILYPFHLFDDYQDGAYMSNTSINNGETTWSTSICDTTQPMFYVNEQDTSRKIKYIIENAASTTSPNNFSRTMLHVYFKTNNGSIKRIYDYQRINSNYTGAEGNTIASSYNLKNKNGLTLHFGKKATTETIQIQTGIS